MGSTYYSGLYIKSIEIINVGSVWKAPANTVFNVLAGSGFLMLQLLQAREEGLDPPWLLPRVYGSQRFINIELSSTKEFAQGHKRGVSSLDIEKISGRYVISGGSDKSGTIIIHDTLSPISSLTHKFPVVANVSIPPSQSQDLSHSLSHAISTVQWYPHDTGMFITGSADRKVKVWDTNEMCVVEKFKFTKPIFTHSMATSESHCLIAVGGKECKITLCDIQSGASTHILRSHTLPVMTLVWSPSNEYLLASGSQDNKILMWDIRKATGPVVNLDQHNGSGSSNTASAMTAHNGHVNGLRFTSDGLHLLSFGTDNALRLWDSSSGRNTLINYGRVANTLAQQCVQLAITPHTSTLHPIVCVPSSGDIVLVEMLTGKVIKKLQGHFGSVNCVTTHPFEQELYSGGSDRIIISWEPQLVTENNLATLHTQGRHPVSAIYQDDWGSDED